MFKENKYSHCYYSIVNNAKSRSINGYVETHHILPKSLGGNNSKSNLVKLTPREHYICHLLLTKFTEGIAYQKMSYALHRLTNKKDNQIKSSRIYEMVRQAHSKMLSGLLKGVSIKERFGKEYAHPISEYQKNKIRESNKNRVWTEEMRQKVSESQKRRYLEKPETFKKYKRTPEHNKAVSISTKSRAKSYSFIHPIYGEFYGTTGDLARAYNFSRTSEAYKLVKGEYKSYKGWTLKVN